MVVFVFSFSEKKHHPSVYKAINLFIFISFSCLFGLRDTNSGTDTAYYAYAFENFNSIDLYWEVGFSKLTELILFFTDSSRVYLFLLTVLSILPVVLGAQIAFPKSDLSLSVIVLVLIFSSFSTFDLLTNGLRQGLAIAICFLSLMIFIRGHTKLSITVMFIAVFFHTSIIIVCAVFLLAFSIRKLRLTKQLLVVSVCLFSGVVLFGGSVSSSILYLVELTPQKDQFFMSRKIIGGLEHYSTLKIGSISSLNLLGLISTLAPLLLPIFIYNFLAKASDLRWDTLFIVYCLLVIVSLLMADQAYSYRYIYLSALISPVLFVYSMYKNNGIPLNFRTKSAAIIIASFIYALLFVWSSKQADHYSFGIL